MAVQHFTPLMVAGRHGNLGEHVQQTVALVSGTGQENVTTQGILDSFVDKDTNKLFSFEVPQH